MTFGIVVIKIILEVIVPIMQAYQNESSTYGKVLVDIDGVILNTMDGIRMRAYKDGLTFIPSNVLSYSFDGDCGVPKKTIFRYLKENETFEQSPMYSKVLDALALLGRIYTPVAYTTVPDNCKQSREDLLTRLGFKERLIYSGDKPYISDAHALIEDNPSAIKQFIEEGFKGYLLLIDHTYNRDFDVSQYKNCFRVEDLYSAVLQLYSLT